MKRTLKALMKHNHERLAVVTRSAVASAAPGSMKAGRQTALRRWIPPAACAGVAALAVFFARLLYGQPVTTAMAQQNAQANVQYEVSWFQNSTRSAPNYGSGGGAGYGLVWRQFGILQATYNSFKTTLTPQQAAAGANELAELDAGLGILEEAFTNYQQEVASGRASTPAFYEMCQVLNRASGVWLQEFNADCSRLQVGWR